MIYLGVTHVISPKARVLLLNIGCIGRHVTSTLSDVTIMSVLFQDGGRKCQVMLNRDPSDRFAFQYLTLVIDSFSCTLLGASA